MQEIDGDIFDFLKDNSTSAICICTNGIVNKYGQALAGAGQAGVAATLWTNFRSNLGEHIIKNKNVVGLIGKVTANSKELNHSSASDDGIYILSFPTKQHFNKPSIPELIFESAKELVKISDHMNFKKIILGRPGCGIKTGQLSYDNDVKPLIKDIFDNRFIIVNKIN